MYKYLIPILLFLLCNFTFGQEKTLPKERKQEEIEVIYPNTLPDSIQILLDKKDVTQEERIDALCKAMDYYALIQESNKTDTYITALETITNNSNNTYYKALFNYYKGHNLCQKNSLSAIKCFYESIRQLHLLQHNNRNKELEIKNYIALSSFYINNDMFLDAYEVIKNGLNINNELKNQSLDFKLKANLASLYANIGLKKEGLNINNQLLELIKDKGIEVNIYKCYILNNIGNFHNTDSAIIYYDSALQFVTTPYMYTASLNNLGLNYIKKDDMKRAELYFYKSLNITKKYHLKDIYNLTLNNIAKLKLLQQQYDSALIYTDKAIDFANKYNLLVYKKNALFTKKQILNKLNRYKECVKVGNLYDLISDSIANIQNIENVKKAVLQEQILEKERRFNDEIAKQNYQNKKEKISLIIIILMLLIIVVILIYIYKLSADKKRVILNNKKLKEEALSNELDLRNRELTSNMLLQTKNKDLLNSTIKDLNKLSDESKIKYNDIQPLISKLKQSLNSISYDNFKLYFVKVHPNFFNNLLQDYPDLTQSELRILAYYKINLSNNEIASILNLTPEGVRSAKFRIKKKLNASESDESLIHILAKY